MMLAEHLQKLAILNFGGIGDEILFSPVLAALRKYLPNTAITVVMENRSKSIAPLLPGLDLAGDDRVIGLDIHKLSRLNLFFALAGLLSKQRFDAVISSGSSPFIAPMLFASSVPYRIGYASGPLSQFMLSRPAPLNKHQYAGAMYYSLAETLLQDLCPNTYQRPQTIQPILALPPADDITWAAEQFRPHLEAGQKIILIHPGVSLMSVQKKILKGWLAASWVELIQTLSRNPHHAVFLCGGPDDAQIMADIQTQLNPWPERVINLYGKTRSLEQLAALIQQADLLVSVDSAPMHLATGYQTPVVALFGPTNEKKLLPDDSRFLALTQTGLSCRPCLWDVRQTSCDTPICLDVSVEACLSAIYQQLTR